MKKNITIVAVILGALALIAFTLNKNKAENKAKTDLVAEKNASVSVKTAQVKTEEVSLDFLANGSFEPIQELTFSAEKSGKVISVLVKEGDYVNVGQTLVIVRSDVINVNAQTAKRFMIMQKQITPVLKMRTNPEELPNSNWIRQNWP